MFRSSLNFLGLFLLTPLTSFGQDSPVSFTKEEDSMICTISASSATMFSNEASDRSVEFDLPLVDNDSFKQMTMVADHALAMQSKPTFRWDARHIVYKINGKPFYSVGFINISNQSKSAAYIRELMDKTCDLKKSPFFGKYDINLFVDGQVLKDKLNIFIDKNYYLLTGQYQVPGGFSSELYEIKVRPSGFEGSMFISFIIAVNEGNEHYSLVFKGQLNQFSKKIFGVVEKEDGSIFGHFEAIP